MKTSINFYLINALSTEQMLLAACQLTEKVFRQKRRIYLCTASEDNLHVLDSMLWTYRDDSFLPHQLWCGDEMSASEAAILLGHSDSPAPPELDVLINLMPGVPVFYQQFQQVLELIPQEPIARQAARERYKYYKSQGCELSTREEMEFNA